MRERKMAAVNGVECATKKSDIHERLVSAFAGQIGKSVLRPARDELQIAIIAGKWSIGPRCTSVLSDGTVVSGKKSSQQKISE